MNAREIMTEQVVSVDSATRADAAMSLLKRHDISGMPVVSEEDRLVGVLSESDLKSAPGDTVVSELMSAPPIFIREETPVEEIAIIFKARKVNRLPVLRGKKLVGIVTRNDVIGYLANVRAWKHH